MSFRLLTEYHSFLLKNIKGYKLNSYSFRLLTEYHSFLCDASDLYKHCYSYVSVSLRSIIHSYVNGYAINKCTKGIYKFPSPYGVSFILIGRWCINDIHQYTDSVSVSLRSIIHSYIVVYIFLIKKWWVSVSLRSIIHSYFKKNIYRIKIFLEFPSPYGVSFILIIPRL